MRRLILTAALLASGVALALPAMPAGATTTTTAPANQFLPGGILALSGTITGPGLAKPLAITGDQAADFMNSWIAYSFYGHPSTCAPQKSAPVYRFTIRQRGYGQVIPISVDFARIGANGCVSMPAQGNIGWAIVSQQRWIAGQNLTEQAFARLTAGHLAGVVAPPTTTTVAPKAGSSGSSSTTWVLVAVIIVVVVAGVVLLIRRRRSSAPPSRGSRVPAAR